MDYPEPLVIPPRSLPHKHTFILLHGRGSSGRQFGPALLTTPIPSASTTATESSPSATLEGDAAPVMTTIDQAFPHARFVFPTAARRRATVYRRAQTNQWFDNWKLDPPATEREELQSRGLRETTAYIHDLVRKEIANVPGGASSVVLGGLSQGCAASLIALLLWEGEPLSAMVGMCGWLPFCTRLLEQMDPSDGAGLGTETLEGGGEDDAFDPFERDDDSEPATDDVGRLALSWLREEVQAPSTSPHPDVVFRKVPTFLGHGTEDDRVSIILGRDASLSLRGLGINVFWREYETLGHWYSGPMLRDLVNFLYSNTDLR